MIRLILISFLFCIKDNAQNIGICTTTPAARLDVGGVNGWNVSAGEGDVRIGNPSYRLKFGVGFIQLQASAIKFGLAA